jgi:PPOX class probable F420-dependent enzyme
MFRFWKYLKLNDKVIKLFDGRNLVFIATIMKDGSPQLSPVWADMEEGHVLVNTAEGRIKHKNVVRDPRVAISVVDNNNPLNMTTMRGKVVEIIPDYQYQHANKLTKKYMGKDKYPFKQPGEKRIILKILPEKVYVLPELKMNQD